MSSFAVPPANELTDACAQAGSHRRFQLSTRITLVSFHYDESVLANISLSSREVSKAWALAFKRLVPAATYVFISEKYRY